MQISLLKKNKGNTKLTFLLKNSNFTYVNALRRAIINEVPTMAIEDVEFKQNSSIIYDEVLAHRLGLVVLSTDLKTYNLPDKCTCKGKGCTKCTVKLTLKVKRPGIVYASDLKSKDSKIKPVHPKTILAKLLKDQEIEFIATATLGNGKQHAKWAPGIAYYTYNPEITVNNNSTKFDKFKDKYPSKIFTSSGKIDKNLILENNVIDACDGICDDIVKINYDDTSFIFNIESWGQLSPKEMMTTAVAIINENLKDFTTALTKLK